MELRRGCTATRGSGTAPVVNQLCSTCEETVMGAARDRAEVVRSAAPGPPSSAHLVPIGPDLTQLKSLVKNSAH
jgi:hypothetical protein